MIKTTMQEKNMHILHLIPSKSWRGGENQAFLLAQGLIQHKIQTTVATPKDSIFTSRATHIPTIHLPRLTPLGLWQIIKFIKKTNVTHIDVHSSHAHNWGLILKVFCPSIILVVHRRVDNKPSHFYKYKNSLIDQYVPISQAISQVLLNIGIPKHKTSVVHSATDSNLFKKTDPELARLNLIDFCNIPPQTIIIGTTAALTEQKGIDTLLCAIPLLAQQYKNIHVCIAGNGKLRGKLEAQSKQLKISQFVTFMGWLEKPEDFLTAIDIFVLPSNNEGLGTSILDAFHAKKCVVATDVGGIPEMVKNNKTGLLVPSKNPKALAEALGKVVFSGALREELSAGGQKLAHTLFTKDLMVRKNIEVYQKLLNQVEARPNYKKRELTQE